MSHKWYFMLYQNSLISLPYPKLAFLKSPPLHSGTYMYLESPYIAVPLALMEINHTNICAALLYHTYKKILFLPCLDCCDV